MELSPRQYEAIGRMLVALIEAREPEALVAVLRRAAEARGMDGPPVALRRAPGGFGRGAGVGPRPGRESRQRPFLAA